MHTHPPLHIPPHGLSVNASCSESEATSLLPGLVLLILGRCGEGRDGVVKHGLCQAGNQQHDGHNTRCSANLLIWGGVGCVVGVVKAVRRRRGGCLVLQAYCSVASRRVVKVPELQNVTASTRVSVAGFILLYTSCSVYKMRTITRTLTSVPTTSLPQMSAPAACFAMRSISASSSVDARGTMMSRARCCCRDCCCCCCLGATGVLHSCCWRCCCMSICKHNQTKGTGIRIAGGSENEVKAHVTRAHQTTHAHEPCAIAVLQLCCCCLWCICW